MEFRRTFEEADLSLHLAEAGSLLLLPESSRPRSSLASLLSPQPSLSQKCWDYRPEALICIKLSVSGLQA